MVRRGSQSRTEQPYEGFTDSGERFPVPETLDTVATLLPQHWSITSVITLALIALNASLILSGLCSKWFHVAYFLTFRVSYDIGLGAILRAQSEHKAFTKLYQRLLDRAGGVHSQHWLARLLHHLTLSQLKDRSVKVDELPTPFRAWLVYKNLVNIILVNDGINYLLLGVKCFHLPESLSVLVLGQFFVGFVLAVFNYWAKVDAHRAIGEYCWYWGDFFFRKEMTLTFDGIFELFPHPMYTVGYSLYYGYSLICRSYTMLFISLIAHSLQLAFLTFVEEPHIERTYGTANKINEAEHRALYDPRDGLFPARKENVLFKHLDLFRSGDLSLIVLALYAVLLSSLCPVSWLVVQVVAWRCFHFIGGGIVLWQQSTRNLWTRHFLDRGRTQYEAFEHWKRTYNLSLTLNLLVFCAVSIRHFHFAPSDLFDGWRMALLALGCCGAALSIWSFKSTYDAIGEFGWFYGDFFVKPSDYKPTLCYTGIYRFLNNPDCVTGYAGQYGAALITQSWTIFWLAAFSHALHITFINLVEVPHMHKLYSGSERRGAGPHVKALTKLSSTVSARVLPEPMMQVTEKMESQLHEEMRKIKARAFAELFARYQSLDKLRGKPDWSSTGEGEDSESSVELAVPEKVAMGESLTVRFRSDAAHSDTDWMGIYEATPEQQPVERDSQPGVSEGRWLYVPPGARGELTFPASLLPRAEGVYEVRYHRANRYHIAACQHFILIQPHDCHSSQAQRPKRPNPNGAGPRPKHQ